MTPPLERIVRDYRLIITAEPLVIRRARQLTEVTGDNLKAQTFDDEAKVQRKKPVMDGAIPGFLSSREYRRDAKALAAAQHEIHQALLAIKRGLQAMDEAVRGGKVRGDNLAQCIGCGDKTILEPVAPGDSQDSGYCAKCEALHRRAREVR